MFSALFVFLFCLLVLTGILFIIYKFYLLLERLVIAKEYQASALDRFAESFANHRPNR
jgi:lipopolysaccharide export LptBFGC system permease protein LptF